MLLIIAAILFVLWLLGVTAFKMTKGVIHIVLVIAIIVLIVHFVGGAR
jgi:hypothetical protein